MLSSSYATSFITFLSQNDYLRVHSINASRSMAVSMTALHYAIRDGNLKAIKLLCEKDGPGRVAAPISYLKTVGMCTAIYF